MNAKKLLNKNNEQQTKRTTIEDDLMKLMECNNKEFMEIIFDNKQKQKNQDVYSLEDFMVEVEKK